MALLLIPWILLWPGHQQVFNTSKLRHNGCHFADDIFKCISSNENVWILIKISLKFVLKGPINNIPALIQIMAWHRPGNKPLSETMMVMSLTQICVAQPQWVDEEGCQPSAAPQLENENVNIFSHFLKNNSIHKAIIIGHPLSKIYMHIQSSAIHGKIYQILHMALQ